MYYVNIDKMIEEQIDNAMPDKKPKILDENFIFKDFDTVSDDETEEKNYKIFD